MNYLLVFCLINIFIVITVNGKYQIFLEKIYVLYYDEEYVFANGTTFKYNRTHVALNSTYLVYKQLPPDVEINVQTYEFLNNEYRPFVINGTIYYCDFLQMHYKMFYNDFLNGFSTPVPPKCPVMPGSYPVMNFIPSNQHYPFNLPFNKFMIQFKLLLRGRLLLNIQACAKLDRDIDYREKYEKAVTKMSY